MIFPAATTFNVGDDKTKKQYLGVLSFNTAGIPDLAAITSIILKVKQKAIVGGGNPVRTLQGFMVDIKNGFFGTMPALESVDFHAPASQTFSPFISGPANGWYSLDLTSGNLYVNKLTVNGGLTQIRLRFKLDDNNDRVANYLNLFSGNAAAANRPSLVIQYYVPLPTSTLTPTITPSATETVTPTITLTATETTTPTLTNTQTVTPTSTMTETETETPTPTNTETVTSTSTETETETVTPTSAP